MTVDGRAAGDTPRRAAILSAYAIAVAASAPSMLSRIAHGLRRATFVPVMWKRLPELPQLMAALRAKAGLSPTSAVDLWRYTVVYDLDPAP